MTPLPAYCESCGLHFYCDGLFGVADGAHATLGLDHIAVDCPRCGAFARILDGTYLLSSGVAELLSGPAWSLDRLRQFREQIREMGSADTVAELEERVRALELADPEAAGVVRSFLRSPELQGAAAAIGTLLGIVGLIITLLTLGAKPSAQEIERIVQEQLHEQQQSVTPAPEPPAPPAAATPPPPPPPSPTN